MLKSVDVVIRRNRKYLNKSGVRRLAVNCARGSVFGVDVMARRELSEEGLTFIELTLRHLFPGVEGEDFRDNYWEPAKEVIRGVST